VLLAAQTFLEAQAADPVLPQPGVPGRPLADLPGPALGQRRFRRLSARQPVAAPGNPALPLGETPLPLQPAGPQSERWQTVRFEANPVHQRFWKPPAGYPL